MSDQSAWYGRTYKVTDGDEVLFDGSYDNRTIYRGVKDRPNTVIRYTYRTIFMDRARTIVYSQKDFIAMMKNKYPLELGGRRRKGRGIRRNSAAANRLNAPTSTPPRK